VEGAHGFEVNVTALLRFTDAMNESARLQPDCLITASMMSGKRGAIREESSWRGGLQRGEKRQVRAVVSSGGALGASPLLDTATCATEAGFFFPPLLLATWANYASGVAVECKATVYSGEGPGVNWVLGGMDGSST